ncbi:hypothetical protein D3C72_1420590 [compost metagenome]
MTTRSVFKKSLMALPSRRNSGFEAMSKSAPSGRCDLNRPASHSPVRTGTVDFSMMSLYLPFMAGAMASATCSKADRSAEPSSRGGVPTQMKTTSD